MNQSFLESLEYSISRALANSPKSFERNYWCDGVIVDNLDKGQELKTHVLKNTSLKAVCLMPKGQYETSDYRFDMKIQFGKEALNYLSQGLDLINVIPDPKNSDWITLDLATKSLIIQLK